MGFKEMLVKKEDSIATVTLNRPEALNALTLTMREEIATAFEGFRGDDSVRVAVLTGAGHAFCAGGDIKAGWGETPLENRDFVRNLIHRAVYSITSLEKPVIAMVNGVAAGGGCNLALACDIVIAADSARFSQSFVRIGLGPDWGGAYFLPRLVGPHRAKELFFTGKLIDAREAERIGLINHVVPDAELEPTVMELARQLAGGATRAMGMAKTLLNKALDLDLAEVMEYEAYLAAVCLSTEDHAEGTRAFREKREPVFKGR